MIVNTEASRVTEIMRFSKNRRIAKYCPCGKSNNDLKFAPYEDLPKFGYCHSCGKTFTPDRSVIIKPTSWSIPKTITSYIDNEFLTKSSRAAILKPNNFLKFLAYRYGNNKSQLIQEKFLIGNSSRWPGSSVFWQIDDKMQVRSGKILQYDRLTGKRNKTKNDWVHSVLIRKKKISEFTLKQCLFGLHQIHQMNEKSLSKTTIAIVESAKSACIMTIICPELIWMSSESLRGLKESKLRPIKACKIVLFPDLPSGNQNPFEIWNEVADFCNNKGYSISVSNLLLRKRDEIDASDGDDLADFF